METKTVPAIRHTFKLNYPVEKVWNAAKDTGRAIQVYNRRGATLLDAYTKASAQVKLKYPDLKDSQYTLATTLLIKHWNRGEALSWALTAAEKDTQRITYRHEQPAAHV